MTDGEMIANTEASDIENYSLIKQDQREDVDETDGKVENEAIFTEKVEKEHTECETLLGENIESEQVEDEHLDDKNLDDENVDVEHTESGKAEIKEKSLESEKINIEEFEEESIENEQVEGENQEEETKPPEEVFEEEEDEYVEPPPPDPAAPYDLRESTELLKELFQLRPEQIAEIEQLWAAFQDYTPAYADLDNYVTEKELVYMLNSLNLMTYTPEQMQELIEYCCKPPHPKGHITYEQFFKMVTIRQRDIPIENELRNALDVFDPENTGILDREYFRESLYKMGLKTNPKQIDNLIKEVDMSNDGTISIEDVIGTMYIDLNREDIQMMLNLLQSAETKERPGEEA